MTSVMRISGFKRNPILLLVFSCLLTTGCISNPLSQTGSSSGGEKSSTNDTAKNALLGAGAGCALGALTGKGCLQGAVVGAAVTVVISLIAEWYFESKKLADAETVNKQYAKSKIKPPKDEIIPATFTSNTSSGKPNAEGQREITITANTDMIGYADNVPEMKQKFALYDENNKLVEEKTEVLTAFDGAGRYQTVSKLKTSPSAKGKKYTIKTTLISGKKVHKENTIKIAVDCETEACVRTS